MRSPSRRPDRGHAGRRRLQRAQVSAYLSAHRGAWKLKQKKREGRLLDQGEIDGELADRASALQALHAFLLTFALRGRNDAEDYWWGRRSADADLEVQVVLRRTVDAGQDAGPILISTRTNHKGGENDIRRTEPAAQGRGGPQGADRDQADPPWGMAPRPGLVGRTSPVRAPAPLG